MLLRFFMAIGLSLAGFLPPGSLPAQPASVADSRGQAVVETYARHAHASYLGVERATRVLHAAVRRFVSKPSALSLAMAREAWVQARRLYGRTEVFRFYDGPIDNSRNGVETLVNAWPLDESYIDGVRGAPEGGIIQDPESFPRLGKTVLMLANERGGEANVSVGWHAIEFLLWGQDLDAHGPGRRSHLDFVPGQRPFAARRAEYLTALCELLLEHIVQVRREWEPDRDNYRRRFERDPEASLRKILTGMVVLTGFEMSGERLAVAYETRDQEEEHSCFSDTTHLDFLANQRGVIEVFSGMGSPVEGAWLADLARAKAPELTMGVEEALARSMSALRAMPQPFDQAVQGEEGAPGRRAVLRALMALEHQAEGLAAIGLVLGIEVPLQPGG